MLFRRLGVLTLLALACTTSVHAEKNATLTPSLTTLKTLVVEETFDGALSDQATGVKGEWKTVSGVLLGRELESDKHAAVLNYRHPNRDSTVRFSFCVDDDTTGFNFSLNHQRGHLFRVIVTPSKVAVSLDKDKRDPKSKAVALATAKASFKPGQWYTMQVEIKADQVAVQTDNGVSLTAQHPKLDADKPNYRFVMRGGSFSLDDLHVWDVE